MLQNRLYLVDSSNTDKNDSSIESKIAEIRLFQRMRRVQEKKLRIQERVEKYNRLNSNSETDAVRNDGLLDYQRDPPQPPKGIESISVLSNGEENSLDLNIIERVFPSNSTMSSAFLWEINFNNFCHKEVDTVMFFFAGVLWKASFGMNRSDIDYYYCIIAPAQLLSRDSKVMCEFRIMSEEGGMSDYVKSHNTNYHFGGNEDETASKGHSKFIHKDHLSGYLRRHASGMRLHLSIELSSNIGEGGELLGCF